MSCKNIKLPGWWFPYWDSGLQIQLFLDRFFFLYYPSSKISLEEGPCVRSPPSPFFVPFCPEKTSWWCKVLENPYDNPSLVPRAPVWLHCSRRLNAAPPHTSSSPGPPLHALIQHWIFIGCRMPKKHPLFCLLRPISSCWIFFFCLPVNFVDRKHWNVLQMQGENWCQAINFISLLLLLPPTPPTPSPPVLAPLVSSGWRP